MLSGGLLVSAAIYIGDASHATEQTAMLTTWILVLMMFLPSLSLSLSLADAHAHARIHAHAYANVPPLSTCSHTGAQRFTPEVYAL